MGLASAATITTPAKRELYRARQHHAAGPFGYHSVVSAPGYTTYYLWFLAGEHRIQATASDPALGWVSVPCPCSRN